MTRIALAATAGLGVALLLLDVAVPALGRPPRRSRSRDAVVDGRAVLTAVGGALAGWILLGGPLAATAGAVGGAAGARRARRARASSHHEVVRAAWPDLLEAIRVRAGAGGLPLPTAVFAVGRTAPPPLRHALADGERIWTLTTDFDRALAAVTARADDPTTALVCTGLSTLWPAAGSDLGERLGRIAADRRRDADTHREARSRLAGARFARRFVLLVPAGLALAGHAIGTGRAAYISPAGQVGVAAAMGVTALCWQWSGRLLHTGASEPTRW